MARKTKSKKREFWADGIRALSIFLVVLLHVSAKAIYEWDSISLFNWNIANLINSFSRISVPLFVMLSGAFLLKNKENLTQFRNKRLPRIMLPWIFWGTITLFYNNGFSLSKIIASNFINNLAQTFFGGFWFMPMILGLYLITPIIKPFIQLAKQKEFMYFFSIWFIFVSLIPTLNKSFGINISYQLPVFIQFIGYFVAGYFLTHKVKIKNHILNQTKVLYLVSVLVIFLGTAALTKLDSNFNSSLYEYLNIPVLISSITGFITLKSILENKKLKISKDIKQKVTKISQVSFGIFLSHALILDLLTTGKLGFTLHATSTTTIIAIPITAILVFSVSATVVLLIKKYLGKLAT